MRNTILLVGGLTCSGSAWQDLHNATEVRPLQAHQRVNRATNPMSALATFFVALNPLAAFNPSSPGAPLGPLDSTASHPLMTGCKRLNSIKLQDDDPELFDKRFRQRLREVELDETLLKEVACMIYYKRRPKNIRMTPLDQKLLPVLGLPMNHPFSSFPKFKGSAYNRESLLPENMPEIAFIGRSNVGKSSLVNAFMQKENSAHTSSRPGRTQSINFYELSRDKTYFRLVDMPGYGFANAPQETVEEWHAFSSEFLRTRKTLKLVCVLIDSKVGLKQTDLQLLSFLEANKLKYILVFTKADIAGNGHHEHAARIIAHTLECVKKARRLIRPVSVVSSRTGAGIGRLQRRIFETLLGEDPMKHTDGGWNLKKNWVKMESIPVDSRPGRNKIAVNKKTAMEEGGKGRAQFGKRVFTQRKKPQVRR